jgi:ComF family protein
MERVIWSIRRRLSACQPSVRAQVDELGSLVGGWLWPTVCALCRARGQPGLDLCADCEADLPWNDTACPRCAAPLAAAVESVCGACVRRPPFMHSVCSALRYAYPVDRLVQGLKYRGEASYGRVLGSLLARRVSAQALPPPQALIPMPLSLQRYRARGFNQSYELASQLAKALNAPIRADLVVRRRDTLEQAGLGAAERRRNVRGAFTLRRTLDLRRVAIIDDVMTTGSTANELAKVLRRGGATNVAVWIVARAGS